MALGQVLKEARESKDLTVSEVAVITRMTSQIVSEIEKEDFHRFTAGIYWRSYIRLYAETMNVDPEPLVEEFVVLFAKKDAEKPAELTPKPVKKRDYNIFPTGETALEKIEKKRNFSDNMADCKNIWKIFSEKVVPIIKSFWVKCVSFGKVFVEKVVILSASLKKANPTYLYSLLGVIAVIIIIVIIVSTFKSNREEHPPITKEIVVKQVRAGIEAPEPYFDTMK